MGLLESQIKGALAIQKGEEAIEKAKEIMIHTYPVMGNVATLDAFHSLLDQLISTCISLGRLKEFHENTLKNDKGNTEKEG